MKLITQKYHYVGKPTDKEMVKFAAQMLIFCKIQPYFRNKKQAVWKGYCSVF